MIGNFGTNVHFESFIQTTFIDRKLSYKTPGVVFGGLLLSEVLYSSDRGWFYMEV